MRDVLPWYAVNEATWFYLSLPLIVAVFFQFQRFWSLRNLDLVLLLCLSPGLLLVEMQSETGYVWLFVVTAFAVVEVVLRWHVQTAAAIGSKSKRRGIGVFVRFELSIFDDQRHHQTAAAANHRNRPPRREAAQS